MTVLSIIFGILMIICGLSCMFTPLLTFMDAGYLIVILVAVFGVIGLIKAINEKRYGIGFVFSILSIIFGILVVAIPGLMKLTQGILIYLVAAWFVIQGIVAIVTSIQIRSSLWVLQLILGILSILVGAYSFAHPQIAAISIGILIGIYFLETGFTLLFLSPKMK